MESDSTSSNSESRVRSDSTEFDGVTSDGVQQFSQIIEIFHKNLSFFSKNLHLAVSSILLTYLLNFFFLFPKILYYNLQNCYN